MTANDSKMSYHKVTRVTEKIITEKNTRDDNYLYGAINTIFIGYMNISAVSG